MSQTDWGRAKTIFGEALDLPAEQRPRFLDTACAGDPALRSRVEGLLAADQSAGEFMDAPEAAVTTPGQIAQGLGDRIGPYTLMEVIGEGGFGVVYAAEQSEPLRRRVALKVVKLGMDTRQVIARFDQERQALALMDHPNVAKVFDAGATAQGRPYFAMELIKGVPITRYCDTARLSPRERLELFIPVCQAVQHAHQKGIVHRDLKPSNVLVTLQDGRPIPKIIDFGIAKATSQHLTEKTVFTELKQFIGTPEYMSPEQADLTGLDIDTRSDVYSLGVLLYELLTGATPLDAAALRSAALAEMQRIIREVDPPRPSTRLSTLENLPSIAATRRVEPARLGKLFRGDLDWIVMMCLEKERARRYQTASALAADLRRHLDGEAVLAAPPGAWYRAAKVIRRHRAAVLAAGLLTGALLLGTAGTTIGLLRAESARKDESLQRRQAEVTAAFLQDLIKGVEPVWALGRDTALLRTLIDAAAKRIQAGELSATPEVEVKLRQTIGAAYMAIGHFEPADGMLMAALALAQKTWPRGHALIAACQNDLGELRLNQGNAQEAAPLLSSALKSRQQMFPGDSEEVAQSLNNLAFCQPPKDALPMFIASLEMRRRILPGNNAEVAEGLNNVGWAHANLGQYKQSIPYHQQALDMRRAMYGNIHPDVALSLNNLASSLAWLGRLDEALPKFQESLEIFRQVCPPDHQYVTLAMTTAGKCLASVGRPDEGLPLCEEALSTLKRSHASAQQIVEALDNIGDCLAALGRWEEADAKYTEALRQELTLHPPDPAQIALAHGSLGRALVGLDRPAEALAEFDQAIAAFDQSAGSRQLWAASALADRSRCRVLLKQFDAALADEQRALQIRRAVYGADDHPAVAASLEHIGIVQGKLGRHADAVRSLQDCLDMRDRLARVGHPPAWARFNTMSLLGEALAASAEFSRAEPLLVSSADGLRDDQSVPHHYGTVGTDPRREALQRLCAMYEAWDSAEPGKGHDAAAARRKTELDALAAPSPK